VKIGKRKYKGREERRQKERQRDLRMHLDEDVKEMVVGTSELIVIMVLNLYSQMST
jgi:hypothetical protein